MANKLINPEIREMLLGHSIGLSDAYYRPTEQQCLNEYLKVVDDLTINNEYRLSKQVKELVEENQDKDYLIKGKLQEKDEQIKVLTSQLNDIAKQVQDINQNTKIDKETIKRLSSEEMFELFLKKMDQKHKKKQKLEQQLLSIQQ